MKTLFYHDNRPFLPPAGKKAALIACSNGLSEAAAPQVEELAAFAYTIRRGDRDNLRTMLRRARTIKETISQNG